MESDSAPISPDEPGRSARSRKKVSQMICPICGVTVRINEIDCHFALELQRLEKTSMQSVSKMRKERSSADTGEASSSFSTSTPAPSCFPSSSCPANKESTWDTYQKIKTNRQTRLKVRSNL